MGQNYSTSNITETHTYGWKRELPDHNDTYHTFIQSEIEHELIDLRKYCPPIYNQGNLGSCTANAVAGAYEYQDDTENKPDIMPSRLFIYYNEREIENTVRSDSGATIRDSIKAVFKYGICSEKLWPYQIEKFIYKPPDVCYQQAKNNKIKQYKKINQTVNDMKSCLRQGLPFIFGFSVYESFESENVAKTGTMTIPEKGEKLLGGHAVMAVGYIENEQRFIIRNSWGEHWGDHGYFYMPYEFVTNNLYASDFWTIIKV